MVTTLSHRGTENKSHTENLSSRSEWLSSSREKIINVGEDVVGVGKETLINCWWECKLVQPLWK
jgi:hypothetical protein